MQPAEVVAGAELESLAAQGLIPLSVADVKAEKSVVLPAQAAEEAPEATALMSSEAEPPAAAREVGACSGWEEASISAMVILL